MGKYSSWNWKQKSWVAILVSDKMYFKTKTIIRDKVGHYIMIKGSTQHEAITVINIATPNTGTPNYIKQILTNGHRENDGNTITAVHVNTPLTSVDESFRQKNQRSLMTP